MVMLKDIIETDKKYYMNTFGDRLPVCFTHGKGLELFSDGGKTYYDFLGGIAVSALGHSHPEFISALKNQLDKVLHTSSLYYIENQAKLAKELVEATCADKAFFCNSGAEANEGALKLAKIYHYKKGDGKTEVISLSRSFHGRTIATVAATGQEKYQKPYRELTNGFMQVEPNDFEALQSAVTDKTAAILLELIQGESTEMVAVFQNRGTERIVDGAAVIKIDEKEEKVLLPYLEPGASAEVRRSINLPEGRAKREMYLEIRADASSDARFENNGKRILISQGK